MRFIKNYYDNIVKYDIINKFNYSNKKSCFRVTKIVLSFIYNTISIKKLISSLLIFELMLNGKGDILKSSKPQIILKIQKGSPIGCKIILKEKLIDFFIFSYITDPFLNNSKNKSLKFKENSNFFSVTIGKQKFLEKFNNLYVFVKDLSLLNVTFVLNSKTKDELNFLLKSFKII